MANSLPITVENPDEILNTGLYGAGAIIRVQSSATEAGAFADLTGTGSTPTIPIVAGTRIYTGFDPIGIVSTWYRSRYENVGATRLSDWTAAVQTGDETGGLLASLYDVKQRLGIPASTTTEDETILELIREVSATIEGYTGRWFTPRPLSGTTTYRVHSRYGRTLSVPKGIRSITTLSLATSDQPASGGVYTTASGYYLDPPEMERDHGWPATAIRLTDVSSSLFYTGSYGAEIVGAFGWASVPADIQGIAIAATLRKYMGKESASPAVAIGPTGAVTILRDISPADQLRLEWYRHRIA